jgi:HK97 gp10 family phage protein
MANEIRLEGMEEILNMLDDAVSPEKVKAAMNKAVLLVERSAKQKAPKGNGELRRSITSKVENDADGIKGVIYTPLLYAPYVEFGTGLFAEEGGRQDVPWCYKDDEGNWHSTSGMKPQPYMRPALNENREEIKRLLKGGITNND